MEIIPATILNPNGMGNRPFWVLATKKDPRKDTRNPPGRTKGAGDTLLGHGSAHFYTGVPPVSALCEGEALTTRSAGNFVRAEVNRKGASSAVRSCDYCGCGRLPAASGCGRAGGSEDAFGVSHRHPPIPPRAAALAPPCGYPMGKHDEER